jgi:cellulose synthase/poly-beta-1,6-N-acetylglucosamine synthase-like glycosyltransferase
MPDNLFGPMLHRPPTPTARDQLLFISVIVPVRNEATFIGRTLEQLCTQDYDGDRFEIIVADGESTDATREVATEWATRFPNVHLVHNPKRWSSAGRNAAIAVCQGEIIVLVDGHCELENPTYLREVADAFERSGADCVGRPQPQNVPGATALQRAIAAGRASRLGHHPDSHIYSDREGFVAPQSVAIAYRREVFNLVGVFDERFDACEDVEFNHRIDQAGLRCFFTPRVRVRYYPRATLAGLFLQMARYGRGRVRLLQKYPSSVTLGGFVPAAWVCGLVVGVMAAPFSLVAAVGYLSVLATYALCVLACAARLGARERSVAVAALVPLVIGTIHLGAGVGQIWEAAQGALRSGPDGAIAKTGASGPAAAPPRLPKAA